MAESDRRGSTGGGRQRPDSGSGGRDAGRGTGAGRTGGGKPQGGKWSSDDRRTGDRQASEGRSGSEGRAGERGTGTGKPRDSWSKDGPRGQDRRTGDHPTGDRRSDDRRGASRATGDRRPDDRRGGPRDSRGGRPDARGGRPDSRPSRQDSRDADRPVANPAPEVPEDVDWTQLDPAARQELRSVPKEMAELVGKHLVAAGRLLDTDPEAALAHARYVKTKASRIPIVREAVGIAAYHAGEWAEALSELRAVRRMTHTDIHVAIIADLERALGRPEKALDLSREANVAKLPPDVAAELRIVAAGARRDLGQLDAAVVALQGADLDPANPQPWSARLFYAYADNLLAAGRREEAATWFVNAADADAEDETDAAERAAELGAELGE